MTVVQLIEDTSVAAPSHVDIGLKSDQIMQRYLVRRIFREAEFEIKESDGEVTIGFITGFDERCLQVSTTPRNITEEPRAKLIYWPIRSIEETGRRVEDLEHFDHQSKIRSYSHALRAQCEHALTNGTNRSGPRRRDQNPTAPSFSAL